MKNRPPSSVTYASKGIPRRSAKWNTTNSGINHSFQPPLRCTSNQDHKKKKNEKYIWWHHLLVSEFDQIREKHCAMHTQGEDVSFGQSRWHRKNGWSSNIFFDYFLSNPEGIPERHGLVVPQPARSETLTQERTILDKTSSPGSCRPYKMYQKGIALDPAIHNRQLDTRLDRCYTKKK